MVLAERDKELMDRELRRELGRHPTVEWHTRCGAPHSIADLERVNAGLAKTIILMHPELGAGDGEVRVPFSLGLITRIRFDHHPHAPRAGAGNGEVRVPFF